MQSTQLSDNELIVRYQKGNEAALEQLISRHQRKVFSSILILVKDRELSEDLFQETFIKVINTLRAGNYQEEGKFLPWVLRIAHNLVIDYFRKQKRMPMMRDSEDYSVTNSLRFTDSNIEDQMVTDQIHKEVRLLIDLLPLDQREVVIMRHYGNMSFKEIAESTRVSINTSLGRMRYALINMRKLMEKKNLNFSR